MAIRTDIWFFYSIPNQINNPPYYGKEEYKKYTSIEILLGLYIPLTIITIFNFSHPYFNLMLILLSLLDNYVIYKKMSINNYHN
jgi:hypothetical protein